MLCGVFGEGAATCDGGASDANDLSGACADFTLLDGAFLPADSVQHKVWRLRPGELHPASLSLLRDDADDCLRPPCSPGSGAAAACSALATTTGASRGVSHEHFLGRKLSSFADEDTYPFHDNGDGTFDATFGFIVPSCSGVYRVPFRMVRRDDAGIVVAVGHRRWLDFCVANVEVPGDKQAVLRQAGLAKRLRHGPSIALSGGYGSEAASLHGATLIIAFASWSGSRSRRGAAVGHAEFELAFRRAGIRTALFVRDPLRAWYLRGIGPAGHTFESVVSRLQEQIRAARPSRIVTVGSSMGGYAAIRAGIALQAEAILAFGPQVVLAPEEREALGLRGSPYEHSLRSLQANGEAEGFALTSLLDVVREPWPTAPLRTTAIQIFVGGACAGDVREAALLAKAIGEGRAGLAARASPPSPAATAAAATAAPPALSCACTIVPGGDHGVAAAMRDSGELDRVLRAYARA